MDFGDALYLILNEGGPFALGVMGWSAWWYERRQNKEMATAQLQLATAQIEATVKHQMAIHANTSVMERLLDRL